MAKPLSVLIAGGGTGGHLYPAIAIGEALQVKDPKTKVHFVGSKFGIEADVLPIRAVPHSLLPIRGLQRGVSWQALSRNILLPGRMLKSSWMARNIIKSIEPDVVVGTGGYASAIPLKSAVKQNIPIILQEQNSFPGMTTKWFADKAEIICVAFEEATKSIKQNAYITGNPIRSNIQNGDRNKAGLQFDLDPSQKTIFLFGGSQGSAALNSIMIESISLFKTEKIQIIWQTGEQDYNKYDKLNSPLVRVRPFIHHMAEAYAIADIVIARAGALTLSELAVCGKPSILVPLPHSAGDHQTKNANALVNAKAAVMLKEKELTARKLYRTTIDLLYDTTRLKNMSNNSLKMGKPKATNAIVNHILQVAQS